MEEDEYDHAQDLVEIDWELLSPNRGFNTSRYYADLPSHTPGVVRNGQVDVGSLILGMGLTLMLVSGAVAGYCVIRDPSLISSRLSASQVGQRTRTIGQTWLKSLVGSRLGHYMRLHAEEGDDEGEKEEHLPSCCLLYTSPSPRDRTRSRMPSSA